MEAPSGAKLGFPGADDLANMFQFKRDFRADFLGMRSLSVSRALNPELQTFDTWLAHNKHRIPLTNVRLTGGHLKECSVESILDQPERGRQCVFGAPIRALPSVARP
ncbi:MAG TPA: hypothetical protein VFR82_03600, partial [Nitrospira sp.]|nr:hypothetical protein [Nitrospira sp.]